MPAIAAMIEPEELVLRSAEAMPEMAKPVVVAAVPVAFVKRKLVSVEEAVEINPSKKAKVVDVAFSPELKVVNGKSKLEPPAPHPVQLPTVILPKMALLALRLVVEARPDIYREVVVAAEPVALVKVKACKVEEEVTRRFVVVALPPSRFLATKAAGTEPMSFLGDISPSQDGVPLVPPISTPKYNV